MPDEQPTGTQPERVEAAPAAPEQTQASAEATTAQAEAPQAQEPDIWERVTALDPDELLRRHSKLAGKLGDLAAKQARKLIESEKPRIAAEAEIDRLAREREEAKRQNDAYRALELENQIEERRKALVGPAEAEQRIAAGVYSGLQARINAIAEGEPKEVIEAAAKAYSPDPTASFDEQFEAWFKGFVGAKVEHERKSWEKSVPSLVEAEVKKALGKANGAEPSPDLGAGAATGGKRTYTAAELARMPIARYRELAEDIDLAVREGRVRG